MLIEMMIGKIHRATITDANLEYVGSITIDKDLMLAADLYEFQKVQVLDINNGNRFETYIIEGESGSGTICINGAAARLVHKGDKVIIIAYGLIEKSKASDITPAIVLVNEENKIVKY